MLLKSQEGLEDSKMYIDQLRQQQKKEKQERARYDHVCLSVRCHKVVPLFKAVYWYVLSVKKEFYSFLL